MSFAAPHRLQFHKTPTKPQAMQAIVWVAWSLTNISIEGKLKISHGGFFFCVHLTRSLKFEQEIKFKTHLFTEI